MNTVSTFLTDACVSSLRGPIIVKYIFTLLTLYLIEMPFNDFENRADPDQAVLVRAARSGSTLFAYANMISDPTQMDLTNNFFVLCTNMKVYLYNYS